MELCLSQGSQGAEIGLLIDDLRALGFALEEGDHFTAHVSGALKVFQQSSHDHLGTPLRVHGRLDTSTAIALDIARGRQRKRGVYHDLDLEPMAQGGSQLARRTALVALGEYRRASSEQGGDNLGPDIERFRGGTHRTGTGWSVDFVAYCLREACDPKCSSFDNTHEADGFLAASRAKGWLLPSLCGNFLPGDIIVWHVDEPGLLSNPKWHGHVGIVWSHLDGHIMTLEGDRGPYPSLVRPYRHSLRSLMAPASDSQLRENIAVVRVR
jgi:CHAP domain